MKPLYFHTRTTPDKTISWFECFNSTRHWVGFVAADDQTQVKGSGKCCRRCKHFNSSNAGIQKLMRRKSEMETLKNSLKIIVKQFEASAEYMTITFDQLATLSGITQRQARPRR